MRNIVKLFKVLALSLVTIILAGTPVVYATDVDFHFGVGAQFGNFKPDKKIQEAEVSKFVETILLNGNHTYELKKGSKSSQTTGKSTGLYLQLGGDIGIDDDYNTTIYVDFSSARQYKKSNTLQLGAGADVFYKLNSDVSFVSGLELHSSAFGFKLDKTDSRSKIKDTNFIYSGGGATLSAGVLVSVVSIKVFTTSNKYVLKDFDTGVKEVNELYKKALPKDTTSTTVGVMVGADF